MQPVPRLFLLRIGQNVKDCVPGFNLSETKESERDRRIDVSPRLFAPWRGNYSNGGKAPRKAHQDASKEKVSDGLPDGRGRVFNYRPKNTV